MGSAASGKYASRCGVNLPPPHAILAAKRLANTAHPRAGRQLSRRRDPRLQQRAAAQQQSGGLPDRQNSSRFADALRRGSRRRRRSPEGAPARRPRSRKSRRAQSESPLAPAVRTRRGWWPRPPHPYPPLVPGFGRTPKPGARTPRYRRRAERRSASAPWCAAPRCSPPATALSARYESWSARCPIPAPGATVWRPAAATCAHSRPPRPSTLPRTGTARRASPGRGPAPLRTASRTCPGS